ncbi:MAG: hypothetical protein A2175_01690 [Candidatus Nealsonbacteria bacterium RBG_13_42_11]|uniref:Flippase-like domain-containing protein n=1 Tax=Candidatus Nealsonbacteria bacterium RBG_13_42_11 TaxID=1801663 RepID=A0A1G2E119_9BACT|nr:MAG: hypothetical protein A2175_01690 [Candidatus Nealsonbacteria bacterium RBG_13_42_11]
MKKVLLFFASLIVGFIIFIWIAETVGWADIKSALSVFNGWDGVIILGLTLLTALIGVWKWQEILKGQGVKVSFRSLLNPYFAGFAIMFLAPILVWGGEVFRGYVLKERNSISWSKGMASVIIDRVSEWTANLAVIFFGSLFFLFIIGFPPLHLGLIFGGTFLIILIGISLFYFKCIKKESLVSFFIKKEKNEPWEIEKEFFRFFKAGKKAMWKMFFLAFLRAGVMFVRTWFLILFLGKTITALPVLSVLGFTYLAVMIPIPAALGSHEAIQAFAFSTLSLGASTATAFTMIIRCADLLLALFGVLILFRFGVILIKNILFKRIDKVSDLLNE